MLARNLLREEPKRRKVKDRGRERQHSTFCRVLETDTETETDKKIQRQRGSDLPPVFPTDNQIKREAAFFFF